MELRTRPLSCLLALGLGLAAGAHAQGVIAAPPEEEEHGRGVEEMVVTATARVSQGGAQDIGHFRGEVAASRIPHPNTLTAEGLLGSHDIVLPASAPCAQLFCLTGEAMRADLLAASNARVLAGIGFATNIEQRSWRREPINLIAVVDKSGSMAGAPLALVRKSLYELLRKLRPRDQLSIVLYGDRAHVHLAPTPVRSSTREAIRSAVDAIESEGSTFLEDGLRAGFALARETAPHFDGRTRVMLFTDERPNVGATDARSFIGIATAASRAGIGLTTIGVGVQFGGELATRIGSVRGGNLFFLRDETDAHDVFGEQLDTMVSELAHDLRLTIVPAPGTKISAVYGVPGELLGWQNEREITLTIPTVFLDTKGGGIFFTLAPDGEQAFLPERWAAGDAVARAQVSYQALADEGAAPGSDAIELRLTGVPSAGLALGHVLVDEFSSLHRATTAHYLENDQEAAHQVVKALRERLERDPRAELAPERELVAKIGDQLAFLAGHGSELATAPSHVQIWGRWRVERASGEGEIRLRRGEHVELTPNGELRVYGRDGELSEEGTYQATTDQLYLEDSMLMFDYAVSEQSLLLSHPKTRTRPRLSRES
jgi:Ca-activated chloride channel family protein